ncbi:DUF4178 domain-containing protein [Polaribacter vadi]|uniref:DUF4178 domain-containing protein n=1 Tax=Polaribacter TaxID=52959 RepID=UPI001C0A336F|nr:MULTISPECIES: DUF4178 domain-containing protein [Polaribacter]MBU3012958.1 DUF4178 domain-containing protein [Polaribacter vadi]MDO6742776.1 DUF4178 domain-containing protein [Polaribacter sp. 1_MG-2023]
MAIKLKTGYTFFYKNRLWRVTEVYKIKWEDGTKSEEFKVKPKSGNINYLEIETSKDGKKSYSFWSKHNDKSFLRKSQKLVKDFVALGSAKFPTNLTYRGVHYTFDEKTDGICDYGYEKEKVNALDYIDKTKTKFLAIELWDDEIEVSTGILIQENAISKIEKGNPPLLDSPILKFIGKYIAIILIFGFIGLSSLLNRCSNNNSWNSDSNYNKNDSTKVYRNNNYYRSRSSGFGK